MTGSYTTTTGPAVEPVSVADAKEWARIEVTEDDDVVAALVASAREWTETYTNRRFITQTVVHRLDGFPPCIEIRQTPVQSITSIQYVDTDGATQTLDASLYSADLYSRVCRILPAWGQSWPSTRAVPNAVTVTYVAGYGDDESDVPERIRTAIKMIVASTYENRQDEVVGRGYSVVRVPTNSKALLYDFRNFAF